MDKKTFSLICAIITSILWGSAFVAQDMGMDFIGPHTFNVGRFLIGFLTLLPFFFIFELPNFCFSLFVMIRATLPSSSRETLFVSRPRRFPPKSAVAGR